MKVYRLRAVIRLGLILGLVELAGMVFPARSQAFSDDPPKPKFAWEVEMTPPRFAVLEPYFDWTYFGSKIRALPLPKKIVLFDHPKITDHYLSNEGALEGLPPVIREHLTQGLTLNLPTVIAKKEAISISEDRPRVHLYGAEGNPVTSETAPRVHAHNATLGEHQSPIVESTKPKQASGIAQELLHTNKAGLVVPNATDWQILHERWKALPIEVKASAIEIKNLSHAQKAEVVSRLRMIYVKSRSVASLFEYLRLKSDAPRLLYEFNFTLDGNSASLESAPIEVSPKEPYASMDQALMKLDEFAELGKFKPQIDDPKELQYVDDISLHLHASLGREIPASKWKNFWDKVNRHSAIRLASLRPTLLEAVFNPHGKFAYRSSIAMRGLIRTIDRLRSHFELREQWTNPRDQLQEVLRWLEMPTADFDREITEKIQSYFHKKPELIDQMAKLNPLALMDYVPEIGLEPVIHKIEPQIRREISESYGEYSPLLNRFSELSETPEVTTSLLKLAQRMEQFEYPKGLNIFKSYIEHNPHMSTKSRQLLLDACVNHPAHMIAYGFDYIPSFINVLRHPLVSKEVVLTKLKAHFQEFKEHPLEPGESELSSNRYKILLGFSYILRFHPQFNRSENAKYLEFLNWFIQNNSRLREFLSPELLQEGQAFLSAIESGGAHCIEAGLKAQFK